MILRKKMKNFKKYKIKDFTTKTIYIKDVSWSHEGLRLNLEDESGFVKISLLFDEIVYLYQVSQESYKPSCWIDLPGEYYPFYYSKKSEMINKLKGDVDYVRGDAIIHFMIIGLDDVVDVLTSDLPKILFL